MCILHIKLTLKLMLSDNINISFKQISSFKTLKKNNLFNLRSKDTRIDHILVSFLIKNKYMKIY